MMVYNGCLVRFFRGLKLVSHAHQEIIYMVLGLLWIQEMLLDYKDIASQ